MKLTTPQISTARFHRRSGKGSCYKKLLSSHPKSFNGSKREIIRVTSPCDNSDDSGLGIENNLDYLSNTIVPSVFRFASSQKRSVDEPFTLSNKRHRADHKTHNELEDSYAFPIPPITLSNSNSVNCGVSPSGVQNTIPMASKGIRRSMISGKRLVGPPTLSSQLSSASRNGKTQLQILNQPEQQHRARYQTEGSRGAVKDRTGNSFPVVKVTGYNKLTTLQVFIGSDQGRVTPHMFYQACRVTGKNSTPCSEKNINGTIVIEIDIDPTKDMTVTCDCVGILKERNVDVEHRFPEECSTRSKKKSTRCRMVFRTVITSDDGTTETLQIASQPIACTQPPGIPEICKKSLTNCPVIGGKELFILGKNFLKDTHVVFQTEDWEQSVNPDKEFLQQTHLVCTVPTFKSVEIKDPVNAKICVVSGNRTSEPHTFTFTPLNEMLNSTTNTPAIAESSNHGTNSEITSNSDVDNGLNMAKDTQIKTSNSALDDCDTLRPVMLWQGPNLNGTVTKNSNCGMLRQNDSKMMPPPVMLPRRSSVPLIVPDGLATNGKTDAGNASSDEITPLTNAVAVASANQMANNSYVSTSYSNLPDVPIIQDFARTFHSLPDVDHPVMKSEPELKVEPLSEPSVVSCTAESDTQHQQSTTVVRSGIKGALLCTSQSTPNIYLSDESYLYKHTSEMYSTTVSKTEPRSSPTDELTAAFEISTSSAPMMPIDSMSNLMLPTTHATHGYLSSSPMQKTSNVLVSISPPSSSSSSSASSSSSSSSSSSVVIDEQLPDKMSDIMTSLNGSSSFKRESYEFEKLLSPHPSPPQQQQQLQQQLQQQQLQQQHQQQLQQQQQQQQQLQQQQQQLQQQQQQLQQQQQQLQQQSLTGCPLKSSVNYENIRNPFCYQNVVSPTIAEANVTNVPIYHQSYMSMEPSNSGMSSSKESMQVSSLSSLYEKQQITDGGSGSANVRVAGTAVTNASKPLSPLAMSIMENSLISDLMKPHQSASQDNNYGAVVPLTKTFTMSKSFLNSQSQDPLVLSDYVPSTLVNNTVSTVPKLEELVNSAADSHMLSERAASLNLLAETTAATNAAAAAAAVASCNPSTTLSLSSFLAERPRNDVLNSVICNTTTAVTTSACDIMAENSMLVPNSSESSATSMYQQCGGDMTELSVAAATVSKQLNLLEMKSTKEEKSVPANVVQVQQMVKKTAEGMFPSEISRMSDRDLLNYINPSCFDEVPRWKNV